MIFMADSSKSDMLKHYSAFIIAILTTQHQIMALLHQEIWYARERLYIMLIVPPNTAITRITAQVNHNKNKYLDKPTKG